MQRLRFRIIKKRTNSYQSITSNLYQKLNQYIRERIHMILDNDILPLVIAPAIFMIFVGLEWWHWYIELPTPSPVFSTITAFGLVAYCFYKFFGHKKYESKQNVIRPGIDRHPELH